MTQSLGGALSPIQRALLALDEMQARLEAQAQATHAPIAVIGLGCRFPGADSPDALWQQLLDGTDAVREVPAARWPVDQHFDPDPEAPGKVSTRWGGFLDDLDRFDASFFGIAPREAERMDPQQRLVLEVAWEAMEHAGQTAGALAESRTGVFLGFCFNDYVRAMLAQVEDIDAYTSTGGANSILANRLSYFLDLRGPSLTVDTACSSSLVSIHLACRSLRSGECDQTFAGGVNVMLDPPWTVSFTKFGMMAKDGRCKSFDARADGFVRGEGCGIVVLKRLADARADGDHVLAVIRGTAVNQDGRTNGLTAPNGRSQEAVVRAALADARLAPDAVGYVESHGTGTILGDPIEVEALKRVYGSAGSAPCTIGAIKTNLGHLEAAAGVAGLIKAVLAIERGVVPGNLHFESLNPGIDLDGSRLIFPTASRLWNDTPRAAGVSSFGFGGTNAHIVLTSGPEDVASGQALEAGESVAGHDCAPVASGLGLASKEPVYLLPISARDPQALRALALRYRDRLAAEDAPDPAALCASAACLRSALTHRLTVTGENVTALIDGLGAFASGEPATGVTTGTPRSGRAPGLVFVFPGQGAQWLGMGRQLLVGSDAFRQAIDTCDSAIQAETGWSVRAELEADEASSRLAEVDVVQPTLFAVQVALAEHWRAWGVVPDAVVGHSMGEVAAAHVAGALSLEDAAAVICRRSRLLRRVAGQGEMAVVELSFAEAEAALESEADRVSVAASNSPRSTVLSGEPKALGAVLARLESQGVFCRQIKVDVASHSPAMDPLRGDLLAALADLRPRNGHTTLLSTVTLEAVDGQELDAVYWVRNLRQPVRLHAAIEVLQGEDHGLFVEISPHPVLLPAIEPGIVRSGGIVLPSLRRDDDERAVLLESLGALFCHGLAVDWPCVFPRPRRRVKLPSYPWQHERFWIKRRDGDASLPASSGASGEGSPGTREPRQRGLLGDGWVPAFAPERRCFDLILRPDVDAGHAYLSENEVHDRALVPGTLFLELMHVAAMARFGGRLGAVLGTDGDAAIVLEAIRFREPLLLPKQGGRSLQVVVTGTDDEALAEIFAPLADRVAWTRYASARLRPASAEPLPFDQRALPDADSADTDAAAGFYQRLRGMGLGCGPAYQGITALAIGDRVATGLLALPLSLAGEIDGAGWHPAVLESALQLLVAALPDDLDILHLTAGADRVWFAAAGASRAAAALRRGEALRVSARVEPDGNAWLGDLRLTDAQGTVLLGVSALRLVPLADGIELLTAAARRQLGEGDAGSAPSVRQALAAATPGPERRGLLEDHLRGALGAVLKLAPARIEMTSSLGTYGTDSVMTLKLRNRLEESLGLTLSASVIWNHPTLGALTEYLADQLGIALDAVVVADDEPPPPIIITIDPDELDESVETQLNRELALVDALLEDA